MPSYCLPILDISRHITDSSNFSLQVFGGAGVCGDFPLARALVGLRTLRIADGPDEVHKQTLALIEIKKAKKRMQSKL